MASLSNYNAGHLHGRWIDATQDVDSIWREVDAMLAESTEELAKEWAIHNYENFAGLRLSKCESFDTVAEVARLSVHCGPEFAKPLSYFSGTSGMGEVVRAMADCEGASQSIAVFATWLVGDVYGANRGWLRTMSVIAQRGPITVTGAAIR